MNESSPFEYRQLTPDDQVKILEARLQQYEAEHFEHSLNRESLAQATDVTDDERRHELDRLDRRLRSIEASIEVHRAHLGSLVPSG